MPSADKTSPPRRDRFSRGRELRHNLRASLIDGSLFSVLVGVCELYLAAFLLEVSKNQVASGLITTVPFLMGCIIQLISPWVVRRLGSHRTWVYWCSGAQTVTVLPLMVAAFAGGIPTGALFLLVTLYWAAGQSTAAAWTSWIGTNVPPIIRPHYFGFRNRWCQGATLTGLLIGGLILRAGQLLQASVQQSLHAAPDAHAPTPAESWAAGVLAHLPGDWLPRLAHVDLSLIAFGILFLIGAVCRGLCTIYLYRQTERLPLQNPPQPVSISSTLRAFGSSSTGRLFTCMCAFQIAMQVAQPFLNPFLLAQLKLSYDKYMLLVAAAYVGRMIALPTLGRLAKRFGEQRVLIFAGIASVPIPLGWMVASDTPVSLLILLATQLLFGVLMAAWELSTFLLLFESIRDRDRTQALSAFYVGNSFSMTLGSTVGGALIPVLIARAGGIHAYWFVFGLSTALRLAVVPLVLRAARAEPVKHIEPAGEAMLQQAKS